MEKAKDSIRILDLFHHPVFLVKDGIITDMNQAAVHLSIPANTSVSDLIEKGNEGYAVFDGGYLTLSISVAGVPCTTVVVRTELGDMFHLQNNIDVEFRTMALISQKLRQPLSDLLNNADTLFPNAAIQNDPQLKHQASLMNRSLYQLLREVSNLSMFSLPSDLRLHNVTALFCEIAERIKSMDLPCDMQITFDTPREEIYTLLNEDLLERAIYNMISNAIKFSPHHSRITVRLEKTNGKLRISVQNPCVPGSDPDGLFFRYLREPSIEDGRQGIGLGLVLMQKTAIIHGGCLLMDHPAEDITRYTITFPLRQTAGNEIRTPILGFDYLGGRDHALVELSDILPASEFDHNH